MNAPTGAAPRGKFLKKITPKTITDEIGVNLGDRKWVETELKGPMPLYDLFGIVVRTKTGHTDKGDWLAFVGQFKAITADGHEFDSGRAHIPVLEDMIYSALTSAKEDGGEGAKVEVALRIGIRPAPKGKPSATGYEYDVQRLVETRSEDDPIRRLMKEASVTTLPALEHASATHGQKKVAAAR